METETTSAAPLSKPAALMRAAQAIVARRQSMAANADAPRLASGASAPGGSDAGASVDAASRAPTRGLGRISGLEAQPGKLLGSIDTLTAPSVDGSGYEVRHADSGQVIARGGTAQEADAQAQEQARQLGRRRLLTRLQGAAAGVTQASSALDDAGDAREAGGKPGFDGDGASDVDLSVAKRLWRDGRGEMSTTKVPTSVQDFGPDAVNDYLELRIKHGWSEADATNAVSDPTVSSAGDLTQDQVDKLTPFQVGKYWLSGKGGYMYFGPDSEFSKTFAKGDGAKYFEDFLYKKYGGKLKDGDGADHFAYKFTWDRAPRTLNPAEQFVGSWGKGAAKVSNGAIDFSVYNKAGLNSLLFGRQLGQQGIVPVGRSPSDLGMTIHWRVPVKNQVSTDPR